MYTDGERATALLSLDQLDLRFLGGLVAMLEDESRNNQIQELLLLIAEAVDALGKNNGVNVLPVYSVGYSQ